jgi:hypothetical protein
VLLLTPVLAGNRSALSILGSRSKEREVDLHVAGKEPVRIALAMHAVASLHELPREPGGHSTQFDPQALVGLMIVAA